MSELSQRLLASPLGPIRLVSSPDAFLGVYLPMQQHQARLEAVDCEGPHAVLDLACQELLAYFAGVRQRFTVPLAFVTGTEFQRQVWSGLAAIPYGVTRSYAELARHIGRAQPVRAVGAANAMNPISIIIPCHRVIGADGSLTGYDGGLEAKRFLLSHELRHSPAARAPLFA